MSPDDSAACDRKVVLVVEDEPLLRMMAADIVEEAGFAPVEASDADEALALLERRADISCIFSDVRMPGSMDGVTLATRVRERWPGIKVILTSGYTARKDLELPPGGVFFPKPYRPDDLTAALKRLTAGSTSRPSQPARFAAG